MLSNGDICIEGEDIKMKRGDQVKLFYLRNGRKTLQFEWKNSPVRVIQII